ncbi:PDDEXK nuclease domain-containing protein [Microbacterium sp. 1P10UB]|uniref:PDDEXK nuclease domain-containing protein n=1 Tax=unclassified Microbacterium TaxID=2609290 RepID=UPI0039A05083
MTEMEPAEYASTLEDLKKHVHGARLRAQRATNNELLQLWWTIGRTILTRQAEQGWGTKIITRLAEDLRAEFPTMKGFSRANLFYMRRFAEAWPDLTAIVQRPVGLLPWGHVIELLDKLDSPEQRDWYAAKDAHHGWSRAVLAHQITTRLHERDAAAPSNFAGTLEQRDSDQAQELTKDPYALQFLAVDSSVSERELEQRLVDRILETMRELGQGFAFVGRQVHFDVDGDDFSVDLLFFHVEQLRYVVIELKTTTFDPRDAGQLGFYVAVVDDRLRHPHKHQPTVGILLVADKNDTVVRYALASSNQPVAVSRYELTAEMQDALPDETAITRAFADELDRSSDRGMPDTESDDQEAQSPRASA